MEKKLYIHNKLKEIFGSSEGSKVTLTTNLKTGKSELVVEKTIREYFPVTDYEKVMDLYERLNCGSGRQVFKLEDLAS